MVRLNAKNNSQTALTRDIGPSETSFTVEDPYSLPTPPFRMTIDEEIMEVGAKNDGTKTLSNVIRAQEGTTAQSHSSGSAVRCRFTAGMYDEIKQAVTSHKAEMATQLNSKVTKVEGKGLSTNDYTNIDKIEVTKVKDKADKIYVDTIKDNLNDRIDNIIATPTTVSEQEIIDARQGKASLGANLTAIKDDLVAHKEDYAKQAEYPIVNLFKNSNFNNAEEWTISSSASYTIINNELILTQNGSGNGQVWQGVTMNIGDKYYVKVDMLSDRIGDGSEVNTAIGLFGVMHSGSGEYEKLSYIIEATATTHYIRVIRSDVPREVSPLGIRIKKPMLVNLTELYGSGNEPTVEEFEEVLSKFPDYWIESKTNLFTFKELVDDFKLEQSNINELENRVSTLVDSLFIEEGQNWEGVSA